MKSLLSLIVCFIFFLPTLSLSAPIKIKLPHTKPEVSPIGQGARLFKNLTESRLKGKVEVIGPPQKVLTPKYLNQAYHIPLRIVNLEKGGKRVIIPDL